MAASDPVRAHDSGSSAGRSPVHMATTTVKVDGMTCGHGLEGVGEVSVSLMMGRAVVHHDPTIIPAEAIAEKIDDSDAQDPTPRFSTTTLAVEGMTCGACTSAVEGGLKEVRGVKSINVSLLSERAAVEHDASVITPEQLADIIEDRGFGATVLETSTPQDGPRGSQEDADAKSRLMNTTVSIDGMTCGACTSSVQSAFDGADGVVQFNISLLAERAIIVHDPTVLSAQQIITIIEDAGFDAAIISSEPKLSTSSSMSSVALSLHGLRDVVAANDLEDSLLRRPGIHSASINMGTYKLAVSYDSAKIGIRTIVEAIETAGYNALLCESDDTNAQLESLSKTKEVQEWRRAFLFSLSFAVPVFVLNMLLPMYLPKLDFGKLPLCAGVYLGDVLCLLLTIPVQFGIGKRFYVSSYKSLKHRSPTMDVLVMLGTSAAFFYSVFIMLVAMCTMADKRPNTVFDTSTMLITFITLGRWLENRAKGQTSAALSRLMSLAPSMTTIYDDSIAAEKLAEEWETAKVYPDEKKPASSSAERSGPGHRVIPTELIEIGDIVVLHPGDKVSADGVVIRGESYVDESMITGEALPIYKKKGSTVVAGTVNGTSSIDFKVTRTGKDTQLSQIVKLVQDAQTSRASIQRVADIVAGYFIPAIISLGLITFFGWMFVSHIFVAEGSGGKVMVCLKLCISVIVFASVMVGTGVVKGGAINHVVFDKTGTLTTGKMTWHEGRRRLWWLIHPIGKAILSAAKAESGHSEGDGLPGSLGDFNAHPAFNGERTRYRAVIGNAAFLRSQAEDQSTGSPKPTAGITQIHVAIDHQFAGTIFLRDTVKSTATSLITGDTRSTALSVASAVGITSEFVHASASPSDKQSIIASMQESGDGINDSPALATASIGIALASGTDVAMEAADIVLMRPDDLLSVPAIFRRIKLNLMWACLYNVIGLPFAMGLFLPFGGFMLPPMAAGAAMAASSVSVVVSSLLLNFWKRPRWMDVEKLEKEAQLNWWAAALSVSGPGGRARVCPRTIDTNDGYVPLQAVDPVV
ncbi:Cu(2+)-transporting P-type ATPase CCC2 [Aspergillus novofumigatus IBT 16806]|uniref:P-type Cu(+) transporter n=1 Tax=Aspergillus novofumigatus (strain IBT 16806) TaxID=1392255 RepID=A0A2I1C4H2_ASPN1|nr:putative copper-transporting ATPase [Aspergillus novofumigatus IBT 16806]PKX92527.1 putative copper-transporting ATPase [Aspergillus novofumigatus IBT 16806]